MKKGQDEVGLCGCGVWGHVGSSGQCAMLFSPQDFLRCVTAALIYFVISITAVAKYSDGSYKAAGVSSFLISGWGCPAMSPF